ncbi:O-antigen ligase family protein [Desulfurispira natronophila]|uniref:O-antigen ligase n=1 Tax=Desulfurispira natronophila TaxID=682562 RepID=A0A7W7Y4D1_9BACT|nr:O-antigen ligase family protein [Desulfurispira natronophila]MBB5021881.1 O-antigen ligase [Desulfurispira natronophila]
MGGVKPLKDGGAILLFCLFLAHGKYAINYIRSSRLAQLAIVIFIYILVRTIVSVSVDGSDVDREWNRFWRHSRVILLAYLPFFLQQLRLFHIFLLLAFSVTALTLYDLLQIGGIAVLFDPGSRIYLSINQQWIGLTLAALMLASVWLVSNLLASKQLPVTYKLIAGVAILILNAYWLLAMFALQPRAAVGALFLGVLVAILIASIIGFIERKNDRSALFFASILFSISLVVSGFLYHSNQIGSIDRFSDDNFIHNLQHFQGFDIDSLERIPNSSSGYRLKMWGVSLLTILEAPLFGHGVNSVESIFAKYHNLGIHRFNHAHNTYLDITLRFGLVGLFLYISLWVLALWQVVRNYISGHMSVIGLSSLLGLSTMFLFALFFESYNLPSHGWYMVVLMMSLMTVPWKKKS